MRRQLFLLMTLLLAIKAMADGNVPFTLSGLQNGDVVSVTISSNAYLRTMSISADGSYSFSDVPVGNHYIKVEATGYNLPDSKIVKVNNDGTVEPMTGISIVITKMDNSGVWTHSWHEDGSVSGYTTSAYVNTPSSISYLGKAVVPTNVPSQTILKSAYHIILSDEGTSWTQEYAYRLLETMKMLPNGILNTDSVIVCLTTNHITDDILIEQITGGMVVTLSTDAFAYANPFYVDLDGVRGRFFSKRLHHAIVSMVTNFGENRSRVNSILKNRFGCSIYPPSINELTKNTTNEPAENFQDFVPRELVEIINMFEEMPEGFHKVTNLKYLIRRLNGHDHPLYPTAAAVTWPQEDGYIEFMEKAFNTESLFETQRLIIHEKTHMLWAYTFSEEIKNDWIALGGWYEDPNTSSGWATTKDTEFVSAYAHAINPNEDMAESVAFYIKNPDMLQSRSLPKYEFIRDRIMHGTRYISKIRDDLTFEVLNLFPDYDYPGKIKSLDIIVDGAPNEDKTVTVDITLNHMEGFDDGASKAFVRMYSPSYRDTEGIVRNQLEDLWLIPVNRDSWHLRGSLKISKFSKSGYWTADEIKVTDEQGNQRFEGENDFVWNMYIDNSLEDLESPIYEKGSLRYNLTDVEVDGHSAQNLEVIYKVTDDTGISSTFARLTCDGSSYSFKDKYGTYDPDTHEAHINFLITEFYPTADYYVSHITFRDLAETNVTVSFSGSSQHEPRQTIHITTPNPDTEYPELDQNRIFVYAEPTHPEAPDGETKVTINYYARDNKSGLGKVSYRLRDPQGIDHFEYYYHRNFYNNYFDGDPTIWERYTINVVLPKGSAPGIWGLAELELEDKALNWHVYNFVETLIFEPDENQDDYVLFAEMSDYNMLNFYLSANGSTTGYSYVYRVISEENGQEINGTIEVDGNTANAQTRGESGYKVDVSSFPAGKIVVIVQIKDGTGKIVAVRSRAVEKSALDVTVSITISSAGFTTHTATKNLDFSGFGDEVKAYVATGYDYDAGTIWLTRVKDVPAGTPIMVKGNASQTYEVPVKLTSGSYYKNMFAANSTDATITIYPTDGDMTNYYLKDGIFKSVNESNTIGKGKCYLQIPTVAPTPSVGDSRSVTLNGNGFGSFSATQDLDFTDVEGLKAYAATGYDDASGTIWLTRVKRVSAGTGLLLMGAGGGEYTIPSTGVKSYYANMMVGNPSGPTLTIYTTSGDMTNYYLKGNKLLKADGTDGNSIGEGKAYMQIPSAHVTRSIGDDPTENLSVYDLLELPEVISMQVMTRGIGGDDDTTGIREAIQPEQDSDVYYNLNGQRVENPGKGLYIKNGKKVILK